MHDIKKELVGEIVGEKWLVEELLSVSSSSTGGAFSIPYRVSNIETGEAAFLKLIDLMSALQGQYNGLPVNEAIQRVSANHAFEVTLAEICKSQKMTRVVHALDSGEHDIEITALGLSFKYPFNKKY